MTDGCDLYVNMQCPKKLFRKYVTWEWDVSMAEEAASALLIKQNCVRILQNNYEKVFTLFPAKLSVRENLDGAPEGYVYVDVFPDAASNDQQNKTDFLNNLQVTIIIHLFWFFIISGLFLIQLQIYKPWNTQYIDNLLVLSCFKF